MEGLVLATDGRMSDYCNILRSHQPDDVLGIEVLLFDRQEVLEVQQNGRPLETAFSFAQEIAESEGGEQVEDSFQTYADFVQISDDSGAIFMELPAETNILCVGSVPLSSLWLRYPRNTNLCYNPLQSQ
ncbi:MAG: hypothetical protein ACK2UJ_21340 [Candidatus Promineifilaceae bacterium]